MQQEITLRGTITKKGVIDGLLALEEHGGLTYDELKDEMGVANGTIQERIRDFKALGLIREDAALADSGRPQKAYTLTQEGVERVNILIALVYEGPDE